MISEDKIKNIVDKIVRNFNPNKIIMFGSYASGTANKDSDLDLLVVMNSDLPRHRRSAPLRLLFNPQPTPMDIIVQTPDEISHWNGVVNHVVTEAFTKGKVLYEKS